MIDLNINIDFSFIKNILKYSKREKKDIWEEIVKHKVAKSIYHHAITYNNTNKSLDFFWSNIVQKEIINNNDNILKIESAINYMKENEKEFYRAFDLIKLYIPKNTDIKTTLFLEIGYDIGIVADGNAFLNLGFPLFHQYPQELIYFSMHELHHVIYTHFHPIYTLDNIKSINDLIRIIKYSTHLEGFGVYCSLSERRKNNSFNHVDYQVLNDEVKREKIIERYFSLYNKITNTQNRQLQAEDWKILEEMCGKDRLWYIAGAHIAERIDETFGREKLNKTIIAGSDSFYKLYSKI